MWSLYPDAAGLFAAVAIALNDQKRPITIPVLAEQLLRHLAQVAGVGNVLFECDNAGCLGA